MQNVLDKRRERAFTLFAARMAAMDWASWGTIEEVRRIRGQWAVDEIHELMQHTLQRAYELASAFERFEPKEPK